MFQNERRASRSDLFRVVHLGPNLFDSRMKRKASIILVFAACTVKADTLFVGDFSGGGREADDETSLGLPYLIARAVNRSGACQALLPASPPAEAARRLWDGGRLRTREAARLCASAGADRYLLGYVSREKDKREEEGICAVTFFLGKADPGDRPQVFKAGVSGPEGMPALADYAAGKACAAAGPSHAARIKAGFIGPFSRVLRLLREKKQQEAEGEAHALIERFPDSADAWYAGGLASAGAGKPYTALRMFMQVSNLDSRFADPLYEEGKLWRSLGRSTLAEKAFDRAAEIQPSFFEAHLESGVLKAERGDCAAASAGLRRALELRPLDSTARYWIAFCLASEGKSSEATALLEKIRLRDAPARFLLGKLYFQSGDLALAERELRWAVRLNPDNADAHALLGEVLSKQGGYFRHTEAIREFQRALELKEKKK